MPLLRAFAKPGATAIITENCDVGCGLDHICQIGGLAKLPTALPLVDTWRRRAGQRRLAFRGARAEEPGIAAVVRQDRIADVAPERRHIDPAVAQHLGLQRRA